MQYLYQRVNQYYFRRRVPNSLIPIVGKKCFCYSLHTDSNKQAQKRTLALSSLTEKFFNSAMIRKEGLMTENEFKIVLATYYQEVFDNIFSEIDRYVKSTMKARSSANTLPVAEVKEASKLDDKILKVMDISSAELDSIDSQKRNQVLKLQQLIRERTRLGNSMEELSLIQCEHNELTKQALQKEIEIAVNDKDIFVNSQYVNACFGHNSLDFEAHEKEGFRIVTEKGFDSQTVSTDFLFSLSGAAKAASEHALAKVAGESFVVPEEYRQPQYAASQVSQRSKPIETNSLSDVADTYCAERIENGDWTKGGSKDSRGVIDNFVSTLPEGIQLENITRDDMLRYRRIMDSCPKKRERKKPPYKGKSLDQLLKMDIPTELCYTAKSLENNFSGVKSFVRWCKTCGFDIDVDPLVSALVVTKKIVKTRGKNKQRAFTTEELQRLFDSDIYKKSKFKRVYYFWTPLIALFTGMRANEVAQLRFADIVKDDDIWCFDVNEDEDGKSVKTKAGKRKVPINKFLLEIGFLDYVAMAKKLKESKLFEELKPNNATGRESKTLSNWFMRYRRKCGVGTMEGESKSEVNFHSLRNTFVTKNKMLGVSRDLYKEVIGHEAHSDVTRLYEGDFSITRAYEECISKIDFEDEIGLSFLREQKEEILKQCGILIRQRRRNKKSK